MQIEEKLARHGIAHGELHYSSVVCIDGMRRLLCSMPRPFDVSDLHHVNEHGARATLDQERLLVGAALVDQRCERFVTPWPVDCPQPITKLVDEARMNVSDGDVQHRWMFAT